MVKPEKLLEKLSQSNLAPPEKLAFILEREGGFCPGVNLRSDLAVVLAGYEKCRQGNTDIFKAYPFYRLLFTLSGRARLTQSNNHHILTPGTICCFHPGQNCAILTESPNWSHYYIHFTGSQAAKLLRRSAFASRSILHIADIQTLQQFFRAIIQEVLRPAYESQEILTNYLSILLLKLSRLQQQSDSADHSAAFQTFTGCKAYLDANFLHLGSIQEICENCHISRQYLSRLFQTFTDTTPLAYLIERKINHAAQLLIQNNFTIKEIAHRLGFTDPFHFSKTFKKFQGYSPRQFQKLLDR